MQRRNKRLEEADMAQRQTAFRALKSIAGTAFLGLGAFILYGNLSGALSRLRHVLGANGSEALGIVPASIMAVSHTFQACAAAHHQLLQGLLHHTLVSSWPLLLVMVGTVLSRDTFTDNVNSLPEKRLLDLSI
jgi:hypothetical protein